MSEGACGPSLAGFGAAPRRRPASGPPLPLALLLLLAPACGAPGRTAVDLDAGWRFHLERSSPGAYCPPAELPINLGGRRCPGLKQQGRPEDGGPATAEACRAACCRDAGCNAWQFCARNATCARDDSPPCWIGLSPEAASGACPAAPDWLGGARATLPRPEAPGSPCRQPQCSPDFDDGSWRLLDLPHDFVAEGRPTPAADKSHGYLPYGIGWYRREVHIDAGARGASVWLDFDGVMVSSQVWVNGVLCGNHSSGYTPFRFELGAGAPLSRHVNWGGRNVIAVRVDATAPDSWWYDGGGIYRRVRLTVANPVHVARWGAYLPAVLVGPVRPEASGRAGALAADAEVRPSVEVENAGNNSATVIVSCTLRDAGGTVVASTRGPDGALPPRGSATFELPAAQLRGAALWTLERPALYTALCGVELAGAGGAPVDTVEVSFGVRSTTWSASQGFMLNGVATKILGTANHQDFPAVGVAVPDELQEHRVRSMKELGSNAWRTAHNAPNEALLDAADRLGVLVWDENHRNGQEEEMEVLVKRDRNHPSVFIWSLCNEALCSTDNSVEDASRLKAVAKRLDPLMGRAVSANHNAFDGPNTVLDLQGFDYVSDRYDLWHSRAPGVPAISSETSSAVSDRGEYATDSRAGHVAGFDNTAPPWGDTAQVAWSRIMERPFIAGGFTWTGWDYRGEPTPDGWPDVNSHFGILDAAGFWKDRAYWYRAWWARPSPPVLHVFPHWNWSPETCAGACRQEGGRLLVDVWAYSNADEVELLHPNGSSLGRQRVANYSHAEWKAVPYSPGRLLATAYVGGGRAAAAAVETTGPAAALRLGFHRGVGLAGLRAGSGVALAVAEVVDSSGRVVPTASDGVTFAAEGATVLGTSNGDPACVLPGTSPTRPAFHGLVMAVVRAGRRPGRFALRATAPGLAPAEPLAIDVLPGASAGRGGLADDADDVVLV